MIQVQFNFSLYDKGKSFNYFLFMNTRNYFVFQNEVYGIIK